MLPKKISTFKTCVFRIHNPTKHKRAMLEDALRANHLAYSKALAAVLPELEAYALLSVRERQSRLAKDIGKIVTPIRSLSLGAKAGLIEDLSQQIESHLALRQTQETSSTPTARILDVNPAAWESVLEDFAGSVTQEDVVANQVRLLTQSRAGLPRPILFCKYRTADGFLVLYNPERAKYGIWLNLHPKTSRHSSVIAIQDMSDVRSGKLRSFKSRTGAIFPVEFGADYQLAEFINKGRPQSAKLVKVIGADGEPHFDIHVSFRFEADAVEATTILGVDRGIYNLASIAVLDRDGGVLHRENIDGRSLRHMQRFHERRQAHAQQNARRYTSSARKAMADEAVHYAANRIAEVAMKHASQVVLEDLRNLTSRAKKRGRNNFNRVLNRSQYAKLEQVLAYKLKCFGLPDATKVIAAGTSQTCHQCGHRSPDNRVKSLSYDGFDTGRFSCVSCLYEDDADLNAAMVIGQQKRWRDGLPAALRKTPWKDLPPQYSFGQFLKDSCLSA